MNFLNNIFDSRRYKNLFLDTTETQISQRVARIGQLLSEIEQFDNNYLISRPQESFLRQKYGLHEVFKRHFNEESIPDEKSFMRFVNNNYDNEKKSGAVPDIQYEFYSSLFSKPNLKIRKGQPKDPTYDWIPFHEIEKIQAKINCIPKISRKEKNSLHLEFSKQVISLISKFDNLGDISDQALNPEEIQFLTKEFLKALETIGELLLKPYNLNHIPKKRPLFEKSHINEDRKINYPSPETLYSISDQVLQKVVCEKAFIKEGADTSLTFLPPQYRPSQNFSFPPRPSFIEISSQIQKKIAQKEKERNQTEIKKTIQQKRHHPIIFSSPPKTKPTPIVPQSIQHNKKQKISRKSRRSVILTQEEKDQYMSIAKQNPENKYFTQMPFRKTTQKNIDEKPVQILHEIFTEIEEKEKTKEEEEKIEMDLYIPPGEKVPIRIPRGRYYYRKDWHEISDIIQAGEEIGIADGFNNDLEEILSNLGLSSDEKLCLVTKICTIVGGSSTSNQFKFLEEAGNANVEFKAAYDEYGNYLNLEPDPGNPDKTEILKGLSYKYGITRLRFETAMKELESILQCRIRTNGKYYEDIIQIRDKKIESLLEASNLTLSVSQH